MLLQIIQNKTPCAIEANNVYGIMMSLVKSAIFDGSSELIQ